MFAVLNLKGEEGGSKCTIYTPAISSLAVPFVLFIGLSVRWSYGWLRKSNGWSFYTLGVRTFVGPSFCWLFYLLVALLFGLSIRWSYYRLNEHLDDALELDGLALPDDGLHPALLGSVPLCNTIWNQSSGNAPDRSSDWAGHNFLHIKP